MKVLVLNGSPKLENSNTIKLTNAFIEGIKEEYSKTVYNKAIENIEKNNGLEMETLNVYKLDIKPCKGCFVCWKNTPGKCFIKDDMESVIDKILSADVIIWSFPLYYFGMPSQLKALMDRQLPMNLPFMASREDGNSDTGSHIPRYDISSKRTVIISTCGFYTSEGNYDSLNLQFDRCFGKNNYEKLYCGQGELFRVEELKKRTNQYLEIVKNAGKDFIEGKITIDTKNKLSELLYPRDVFEAMADASWGIEYAAKENKADEKKQIDEKDNYNKKDQSYFFTKQMAALYNKKSWNGSDKVLEMNYTDINKTYQIILSKDGAEVIDDNFKKYTTKIKTPISVWMDIAKGVIDGKQAVMQHMYTVSGDFELMMNWDEIFGVDINDGNQTQNGQVDLNDNNVDMKKSNMNFMLIPWIVIWISLSIDSFWGGILGITASSIIPLIALNSRLTIFDALSFIMVSIISILAILGVTPIILMPTSYLLFGIMWTFTVFRKIPLTAYYSMNDFGEKKALENPLFLRTNRILTAAWGILYLITPIWTYFLMNTKIAYTTGIINSILPVFLGIFTKWFIGWYPPYYLSEKN